MIRAYIKQKPFLFAILLGVIFLATVSGALTERGVWNTVLDQTNSRIRLVTETYDSTAGSQVYTEESIANQVLDTTDKAIAVSLTGQIDTTAAGVVVNEDSTSTLDFRVESDGNANALFVDASTNRVGILNASPTVAFDVTGISLFTGAMTIEGATTVNDTSADVDFRIESNGNANAVFVDAGNDRVGIFTAAPTVPLEVTGAAIINGAVTLNESSADVDFRVESNNVADALQVDAGADYVKLGAGLVRKYTSVAAESYTLLTGDQTIGVAYTDTGLANIFIPDALVLAGREFQIFDSGVNADNYSIYLRPTSKTINEAANLAITTAAGGCTLVSDGTNWFCY